MASQVITNAVEMQVLWTLEGQNCENRFMVRVTPPITNVLLTDLSDLVGAWVNDHYRTVVGAPVLFRGLLATDRSVPDGLQLATPLSTTGAVAAPLLANEVSFCLKLTTGYTGRSKRGRWYMPPPAASQLLDSNHVAVASAEGFRTTLQLLVTDLAASDYHMGVASLVHNGVPVLAPSVLAYTVVTYTDTLLDSMKSRKPGIGS